MHNNLKSVNDQIKMVTSENKDLKRRFQNKKRMLKKSQNEKDKTVKEKLSLKKELNKVEEILATVRQKDQQIVNETGKVTGQSY